MSTCEAVFESKSGEPRIRRTGFNKLFLFVTYFLFSLGSAAAWAEAEKTADHCAKYDRQSDGRPKNEPPITFDPDNSCSSLQRVRLKDSVVPAMRRLENTNLIAKLRSSLLDLIYQSKIEALRMQECFGPQKQSSSATPPHDESCRTLREHVQDEVKLLPQLRQHMALRSVTTPSPFESEVNSPEQKFNPLIYHSHSSLSPEKLTSAERAEAEKTYDGWLTEALKDVSTTRDRRTTVSALASQEERNRILKQNFVLAKRAYHDREYKRMMQENPFLGHFSSADGTADAAIVDAAKHLENSIDEALKKLDELKKDPYGDEALHLFLNPALLENVLQKDPQLCAAANRMVDELHSRESVTLLTGTLKTLVGALACLATTELGGLGCIGLGATASMATETVASYSNYTLKRDVFNTAVTADKNLIQIIDDLDAGEREVFLMGVMTVLPYEVPVAMAIGKAPHAIKAASKAPAYISGKVSPAFQSLAQKIEARHGMRAGELIKRMRAIADGTGRERP